MSRGVRRPGAGRKKKGTCPRCHVGTMAAGTKSTMLERGRTILVLRRVPAVICGVCGDAYYAADVTDALAKLLDAAERSGAEFLIIDYAASGAFMSAAGC